MAVLQIDNQTLRRLWLHGHGLLAAPPHRRGVMEIIRDLGFVQIDTIRNVVRAQDHILWSRSQSYREGAVWAHLENRELFEHFTHDASLIAHEILPLWGRRFADLGARAARGAWYQSGMGQAEIKAIKARIEAEGALSTHAFDTKVKQKEMWARPPHKKALEQMWYAGELATARRENFIKFYDLGSRVLGQIDTGPEQTEAIAALHAGALDRLQVASPGEVARFWDIVRVAEARPWCAAEGLPVEVEGADGRITKAIARRDIEDQIAALPEASPARIRIINPFDPAFRDRARTERIFGFHYRNEMFVPPAKRAFGYYVYPLLEGTRFVGRLEAKADKDSGALAVTGFWPEAGVAFGAGRRARLNAELERFARLGGLNGVTWRAAPIGETV